MNNVARISLDQKEFFLAQGLPVLPFLEDKENLPWTIQRLLFEAFY